jgi:hypothetical protein
MYLLVVTGVPAEGRFTTAVAERLKHLGAITHGDRRVSDTCSLSRFYMNPGYAKLTLKNILRSFCEIKEPVIDRFTTPRGKEIKKMIKEQMIGAGILQFDAVERRTIPVSGCYDLEKFFNRLFAIDLGTQERLMDIFHDTFKFYTKENSLGEVSSGVIGQNP